MFSGNFKHGHIIGRPPLSTRLITSFYDVFVHCIESTKTNFYHLLTQPWFVPKQSITTIPYLPGHIIGIPPLSISLITSFYDVFFHCIESLPPPQDSTQLVRSYLFNNTLYKSPPFFLLALQCHFH